MSKKAHLIIETDIGHDPDDFFAICYLIAAGAKIDAILVTPGDPDQVAMVKVICKENGLDIPVGVAKLGRTKLASGGIHTELRKRYNADVKPNNHDGEGFEILYNILGQEPPHETELFIIGPCSSVGKYLAAYPDVTISSATMQGGFLPYKLNPLPCAQLEAFVDKDYMPTFNLNGDRNGGMAFINANNIKRRQFVGKHVCHTVSYDISHYKLMKRPVQTRAGELFMEGMAIYLERHPEKKFHDPLAAACHLHPNIATWIPGKVVKMKDGWTTEPRTWKDGADYIIADLRRDLFWRHIYTLV